MIFVYFRHAHKHTVMDLKWNKNGNWMLTASRDHLLKLFDIRNMKEEMQSFRGHKKEATSKNRFLSVLQKITFVLFFSFQSVYPILQANNLCLYICFL